MKKLAFALTFLFCAVFFLCAADLSLDSVKLLAVQDQDKSLDTTVGDSLVVMSTDDYLVTAGDVYVLGFYAGNSPVSYNVVVDPSYKIKVANLGYVDANGMTFVELKQKVEDIVSANYPMSGVQLVIKSPGTFRVTVKGEVASTASKVVSGLVRLSDVTAGYGTSYASSRFFTVISADGTSRDYDLFLAERFGDLSQNPYMRPDDTVVFKRFARRVSVSGLVERPGTYELSEGENMSVLVNYYGGGLDILADTDRITLSRAVSDADKAGEVIYLDNSAIKKDYRLKNRDSVYIGSRMSLKKSIFIQGAVNLGNIPSYVEGVKVEDSTSSLSVEFTEGESYCKFMRSHKSLFSDVSDIENAYIIRNGKTLALDLKSILYDAEYESDLKLCANDIVVVPFRQFYVTVTGAVNIPGRYAYVPDRTWDYYVNLAGGLDEEKNVHEAVEISTKDGKSLNKADFIEPESTIKAPTNSSLYKFNKYAVPVTTSITIITSILLGMTYIESL